MVVALLGFGTVGRGVYEILAMQKGINVKYVLDITLHSDVNAISTTDFNVILNDAEVETVIEVIGGINPAYDFVKKSLMSGKNVISANKLLISSYYRELTTLAADNKVAFRYTAAAGGGIPWLVNLERVARIAKVNEVSGIMNGTSNYILDAMHTECAPFAAALKTAQELGFAEHDPSADIDGIDTLCKTVLSANIAFSACVDKNDADVAGIRYISTDDIDYCESLGCVCKLIGTAKQNGGSLSVYVEPVFVRCDSPEASIHKNLNLISFDAEHTGRESFSGFGAGRYPTAYTVVNDCVDVANGVKKAYNDIVLDVKVNNFNCYGRYYINSEYSNDWFNAVAKQPANKGFILNDASVGEVHAFYKEAVNNGKACFIAAVL